MHTDYLRRRFEKWTDPPGSFSGAVAGAGKASSEALRYISHVSGWDATGVTPAPVTKSVTLRGRS